jgi:hypothetical protein
MQTVKLVQAGGLKLSHAVKITLNVPTCPPPGVNVQFAVACPPGPPLTMMQPKFARPPSLTVIVVDCAASGAIAAIWKTSGTPADAMRQPDGGLMKIGGVFVALPTWKHWC